jgi:hypothetical protein
MTTLTVNPGDNIQAVINAASAGSIIDFNPGTYNIGTVINLKSGVSLEGSHGAVLATSGSNGLFQGLGVHDITIDGFTLDGSKGDSGNVSGAIYLQQAGTTPSNNIHITNDTFQNFKNSNDLWLWSTQNTLIQNDHFQNGYQAITWDQDPGAPHLDTMVIAGNTFSNFTRMGVETALPNPVSNFHVDNNVFSNIGIFGASIIAQVDSGTISGNTFTGIGENPLEIGSGDPPGPYNVTVSQNTSDHGSYLISHVPGSVIEGNTINGFNSAIYANSAFNQDGGYDGTEFIGTNVLGGVTQTGWPGSGEAYGVAPTIFAPWY